MVFIDQRKRMTVLKWTLMRKRIPKTYIASKMGFKTLPVLCKMDEVTNKIQ